MSSKPDPASLRTDTPLNAIYNSGTTNASTDIGDLALHFLFILGTTACAINKTTVRLTTKSYI